MDRWREGGMERWVLGEMRDKGNTAKHCLYGLKSMYMEVHSTLVSTF